jgi:hypothetical protein
MALLGAFVLYVDQSACGGRAWIVSCISDES